MVASPDFQPYESTGVTGEVLRWAAVPSAHLTDTRDVLVWLPPGYHAEPLARYAVLYLHDGQNKFDAATSYAGVDWNVDGIATQLIEQGEIEPLIMVAIYNTPHRLQEYNPLDQGAAYGSFIVSELMPVIDQEFRTQGGRRNALIGSSMGGLISLALLWWHSEKFFGAACFSPSLWMLRRAGSLTAWLRRQAPPLQPSRLYLDHGTVGVEGRGASLAKEVIRLAERQGFSRTSLTYHVARGGEHNEASWRARLDTPLKFLFGTGEVDG